MEASSSASQITDIKSFTFDRNGSIIIVFANYWHKVIYILVRLGSYISIRENMLNCWFCTADLQSYWSLAAYGIHYSFLQLARHFSVVTTTS